MEVPVVQRPGPRWGRVPSPDSLKGRLVWEGRVGESGEEGRMGKGEGRKGNRRIFLGEGK